MRYIEEEWNRIDSMIRKENLAFNIKVIRAMWILKYGTYGEKSIKNAKDYTESIYSSLERSQETLRQIELQQSNLKQTTLFNWAKKIEDKTDIPGEYLTGQEIIDLTCVDGSTRDEYEEYFIEKTHLNDMIEELKQHESSEVINQNLEFDVDNSKKMNLREMEHYIEKCDKKIEQQIKDLASDAQQSINFIKEYDERLDESLRKLLTNDFEIRLEKYDKIYRLVYYIYYGKKSGTGNSISQLIKILEKKKATELKNAGEELLYNYIIALRKQLKLAESVYIVASDYKDFKNEKKLKDILS